uniref:Uncharacterized protein n=1 Tax=Lepeophtheirus salmonis TaxID=72036 RepID=A0A0K2UTL5_LEPSM
MCRLLFLWEKIFRQHNGSLGSIKISEKLLIEVLTNINMANVFEGLSRHA